MNVKHKNRIFWIDNLKALGIFLVVVGHYIPKDNSIFKYIYSFHVPLFFFLSGFFYNSYKYNNFKIFIRKKVKTLLIPYFCFSIITYIYWLLVIRRLSDGASIINPLEPIVGIFYSNAIGNWMIHDGPLWFITCLFVVEIVFYFINKYKKKSLIFYLIIFSILGFLDSLFMPFRLPWGIDISLTAIVFYGFGFIFKSKIKEIKSIISSRKQFIILILIFFIGSIMFSTINTQVDMNKNMFGNIIYFYCSSLCGILLYSIIFMKIFNSKFKIAAFIGQNTIVILSLHIVILGLMRKLIPIVFKIPKEIITQDILVGFIISGGCILICIPICYFINKYMPFIIGKKSCKND